MVIDLNFNISYVIQIMSLFISSVYVYHAVQSFHYIRILQKVINESCLKRLRSVLVI